MLLSVDDVIRYFKDCAVYFLSMSLDRLREFEEFKRFLFCCGLLEDRVHNAYRSLASRLDDGLIKILLNYIAEDSKKHSNILIEISKELGATGIDLRECEEAVGSIAIRIIENAEKISAEKDKIRFEKFASMLDDLVDLERYFGEEYLIHIQLKLFLSLAEYKKVDLDFIKEVLEYIIEDERRHEKILNHIKDLASNL